MSRVLVVEDSESIQLMLKMRLEISGHEVLTAADGIEALEVLDSLSEAERPEVILLDAVMPRLDGLGFLKGFKTSGYYVPVIVVSAQLDLGPAPEWDMTYATMSKPIDFTDLLQQIEAAASQSD